MDKQKGTHIRQVRQSEGWDYTHKSVLRYNGEKGRCGQEITIRPRQAGSRPNTNPTHGTETSSQKAEEIVVGKSDEAGRRRKGTLKTACGVEKQRRLIRKSTLKGGANNVNAKEGWWDEAKS